VGFETLGSKSVTLKGGEVLEADLVYKCIGVFPNTVCLKESAEMQAHFGFRDSLNVNDHLQLEGRPNVYAIGDCMSHASRELKLGHTAEVNGHLAAINIERAIEGKALLRYPDGAVGNSVTPKIYALSLGPYDATLGFNGLVINGIVAALMKWMLEWTKVAAAKRYPVGTLFWHVADTISCFLGRTVLPTPKAKAA
jgi:NADH dehydrogenase FAD-containing subunit